VLTPEQRLKLNALRDRREKERKALDERLQQEKEKLRLSPDGSKQPDSARKRSN
jgi:hypothetical protein